MLTCITYIEIQQNASKAYPARAKKLFFDFANELEADDGWDTLTDKAKVVLPKNLSYRDDNNRLQKIDNIGGFTENPFFLKGDSVKISYGYQYFDKFGNQVTDVNEIFSGYISKVISKMPFTLEREDAMWLLKQTPATPGEYNEPVENMVSGWMPSDLTVNQKTQTSIGKFTVNNGETVAQVLMRLKKDAHLEAFFAGTELRIGFLVYDEQQAIDNEAKQKKVFRFQHNIIEDSLEYTRKDDVKLSATAKSFVTNETGETCKDGAKKTKKESLEVLVYNVNDEWKSIIKKNGESFPDNDGGERRSFFFLNVTEPQVLIDRAKAKLENYYYTGFKGTFTTFAIPFTQSGDNVYIVDAVLPERSGYYKVKSVKYSGGVGGHRQEITLDYLIRKLTEKELITYGR